MRAQAKGRHQHRSFVAVMGAATSQISYSAVKGGSCRCRGARRAVRPRGIRVNARCPGRRSTTRLLQELFAKDAGAAPSAAGARAMACSPSRKIAAPSRPRQRDDSSSSPPTFLVDGGISGAYVTPL